MSALQIVQLIMNIAMPLVSVALAAMLVTKRERSARTMTLFYDLVEHVHEFMWAYFASSSHARRMGEYWNQHNSGQKTSENFDDLSKESVESGLKIRRAATALEADCLMLKMLFKTNSRELVTSIQSLKATAKSFERKCPDYRDIFPVEQAMRGNVEQILKGVEEFWAARVGSDEVA